MADLTDINPTLFGGDRVNFNLPDPAQRAQEDPPPAKTAPAHLALQGTPSEVRARAVQEQLAVPTPSIYDSIAASAANFSVVAAWSALNGTQYADDPAFKWQEAMLQVPMSLSTPEQEFLQSGSAEEFQAKLDLVKRQRELGKDMAAHPAVSMLTGMLDPGYLLLGGIGIGARAAGVGRAASAATSAAAAGGLGAIEATQRPMELKEIVLGAMLEGAAVSMISKGGKMVRKVDDFPDAELKKHIAEFQGPLRPGTTPMGPKPKVTPAQAAASAVAPVLAESEPVVRKGLGAWVADKLYWNAHNTLSKWDSEVADKLLDNNRNLGITSVESQHRAIRAELHAAQYEMEEIVAKAAKARGASLWQRITRTGDAARVQQTLEREIFEEMLAREQFSRQGRQYVSKAAADVQQAADALEKVAQRSLDEMTAAGVRGLEDITPRQGWISRRWNLASIEGMEGKLAAAGMSAEKAHQAVVRLVATGLRRANGWDDILSYDVAASIIDRAKRKGYLEDAIFETNQSNKVMHQVRDELSHLGIPKDRLDRVMKVLEGHNDEVGKPGFLKRRLDMDYKAAMVVNGETLRLTDLLDSNVLSITDRYLDGVASKAAWARSGYKGQSDIDKLREQLLHKTPAHERQAAAQLFDNITAALDGRPAGQAMNDTLRKVQQFTRMLSLRNSGIFQLTEYATAMARFGLLKTVKYAAKNMPGFRSLLNGADKVGGKQLQDILARISNQDIRIRPFVHRFEDNFDVNPADRTHLRLQQASQLVPYINAMKFVHSHQAQMVAGLVVDRVQMAAKGNAKAVAALEKYGIKAHVWERLKADIGRYGNNVDLWSAGTWDAVRPAMAKMMDESVMRARMGDLPAFAQFDNVGKFIFTYRSFVLGAHNKLLAGTLDREGIHGLSLLMIYQYPLSAFSTQMTKVAAGKEPLSDKKLASATVANMGSVGLISELWGVVSGEKREFGSPGTIAVDRMYKLVGSAAGAADPDSKVGAGDVASAAFGLAPLLSVTLPAVNIAEGLKTKEK